MTGNRGMGSRFQVWIAVPVTGLVAGTGLAVLAAQGLDRARSDRTPDVPSAADVPDDGPDDEDPAAALRVRPPGPGPATLLRPQSAVSPVEPARPAALIVSTVLSSPVWSGVQVEYPPDPVPAPAPAPVVVATPPPSPSPPLPADQPSAPTVEQPPVVVEEPTLEEPVEQTPPSEEPEYGSEEPPVEEAVDPQPDPVTEPVVETNTEQTTTGAEPTSSAPLVETAG